jgi:hypothetical protein
MIRRNDIKERGFTRRSVSEALFFHISYLAFLVCLYRGALSSPQLHLSSTLSFLFFSSE